MSTASELYITLCTICNCFTSYEVHKVEPKPNNHHFILPVEKLNRILLRPIIRYSSAQWRYSEPYKWITNIPCRIQLSLQTSCWANGSLMMRSLHSLMSCHFHFHSWKAGNWHCKNETLTVWLWKDTTTLTESQVINWVFVICDGNNYLEYPNWSETQGTEFGLPSAIAMARSQHWCLNHEVCYLQCLQWRHLQWRLEEWLGRRSVTSNWGFTASKAALYCSSLEQIHCR